MTITELILLYSYRTTFPITETFYKLEKKRKKKKQYCTSIEQDLIKPHVELLVLIVSLQKQDQMY